MRMMKLNSIDKLYALSKAESRLILGLMSGTSLDGVDLALVRVKGSGMGVQFELLNFETLKYPEELHLRLSKLMVPSSCKLEQLCLTHIELGQFFGDLILKTLSHWQVDPQIVDCISSHGQTIYHWPNAPGLNGQLVHSTLQIGDADQIAYRTGIFTVADLRTKDIAAGGQGAPLIPYVNRLLFSKPNTNRVLHNLGGISNLTWLPGDLHNPPLAFDTGPANVLINLAVARLIDPAQHFDAEGTYAAKGQVNESLLKEMLSHPFFAEKPPKSTGREMFGAEYFEKFLLKSSSRCLTVYDQIATLTEFTASSIAQAYRLFLPLEQSMEIFFSGGGVHNHYLMARLKDLLQPAQIGTSEDLGVNADALEAIGFAIMANELLCGGTVTIPGVTGCQKNVSLGKLSFP